jgi:uncharacterized protein (DUF488 family)
METAVFRNGIGRLIDFANAAGPLAMMCAEAVWWRCHRALISDYLKAAGSEIIHILDSNSLQSHPFTSVARIVDGKLNYGADDMLL